MVREDSNNDDNSSADESENDDENDDDIDDDVGGNKRKKTKGEEEHKFRWRKRDVTTTPDKVFQPEVDNIKEKLKKPRHLLNILDSFGRMILLIWLYNKPTCTADRRQASPSILPRKKLNNLWACT